MKQRKAHPFTFSSSSLSMATQGRGGDGWAADPSDSSSQNSLKGWIVADLKMNTLGHCALAV